MIYIPFVYFLLLFIINFYRTRTFNLGSLLLVLYAFSSLLSIFLYSVDFLHYKDTEIKLSSCIFYCGTLTLFFLPFLSGKLSQPGRILLPSMKAFTLVSFFLIVINIVAIILLLKVIIVLVTNDDPKSLRDSGLQSIYAVNTLEALGQWILGHFSDLYVLLLVCFFYSITYLKNKPIFNILLLVSSMSTIVNGLFSGGRTQFIYWILVFIACFVYFKKDMSKKSKRNMMIASVAIFSLLSVYLTVVTISRFNNAFSDATEYAEGFSLLDYAGQSFLNFNDFFANYHHQNGYTLARIFPFMYDWYSATNFDLMIYKHTFTIDIGVFSTFLGDFYLDIGILGIAIYTIWYLAAVVFTQRTYIPNSIKFQQVLLLFLLYQIPLNGIFYYSLYNKTAVISIFATIFIALIFKFSEEETIEVSERPSD